MLLGLAGGQWLARESRVGGAGVPAGVPPEVAEALRRMLPEAREAYAFALERPDVLQYIPCYCGCAALGHRSNLECFVRSAPGGGVVLEAHGAG